MTPRRSTAATGTRRIRSCHGGRWCTSPSIRTWCRFNDVGTCFIDPGSRWQNAWIESFNGWLRDEFLNGWQFGSLREAQVLVEDWRIDYNSNRPHSAFGRLTPTEFANQWVTINQPKSRIASGPLTGDPSGRHFLQGPSSPSVR